MKCRVGDLAVVIAAHHRSNLGGIVRILAPHDGTGKIIFTGDGHVWLVDASHVMTWSVGDVRFFGKTGPVPDCQLQPIREQPSGEDVSTLVRKALWMQKKKSKEIISA